MEVHWFLASGSDSWETIHDRLGLALVERTKDRRMGFNCGNLVIVNFEFFILQNELVRVL